MAIKLKATERMLKVGPNAGKYARILSAELYSSLAESKVIEEAALRSGKEVKRVNSSDPGTESPDISCIEVTSGRKDILSKKPPASFTRDRRQIVLAK